jgi:hypothetical protein
LCSGKLKKTTIRQEYESCFKPCSRQFNTISLAIQIKSISLSSGISSNTGKEKKKEKKSTYICKQSTLSDKLLLSITAQENVKGILCLRN